MSRILVLGQVVVSHDYLFGALVLDLVEGLNGGVIPGLVWVLLAR